MEFAQFNKKLHFTSVYISPGTFYNVLNIISFLIVTSFCRKFVSDIMHIHDNDGFNEREPATKRVFRVPKYPIGIHERWSGDGHDKLYKIGFPVWAMVD